MNYQSDHDQRVKTVKVTSRVSTANLKALNKEMEKCVKWLNRRGQGKIYIFEIETVKEYCYRSMQQKRQGSMYES